MGKGIDNQGLPYLSIRFERYRNTAYIFDRLAQVIGFRFDGNPDFFVFRDRVEKSRIHAADSSDNKQIEVLFTLLHGRSWRVAKQHPTRYILVESKAQKALRDRYDKEDATKEALKKQRATNYDVRMEAQKKYDAANQIIRDSTGKELLNIYAIQRRGSSSAAKLDASFERYERSGFEDECLRQVIFDYHAVLESQVADLQEFNTFLMSESSTLLGRSVTKIGEIDRPNLTNVLAAYNVRLAMTLTDYKAGSAPEQILDELGLAEHYCNHASKILKQFYEESVSQARRIALALQIVQMAIPVGGSASFVRALCLAAASKFSYTITNKIRNGGDLSWADTLADAAVGSVRDTIMRFGVTKLVGKIPKIDKINGISGEALRLVISNFTAEVAQAMAGYFKGDTFGEALANLHRNLTSYETWVAALVDNYAAKKLGKFLDVSQSTAPARKVPPEGSGTKIGPAKKPIKIPNFKIPKKSALAVTVALMFGPAAHTSVNSRAKKPTTSETRGAEASNTSKPLASVERLDYLNRGVSDNGVGSKTPADRGTSNATAGPATTSSAPAKNVSGKGSKPPSKPQRMPTTVPPAVPPKRSKRGKILKLFQDAEDLLDKVDNPEVKKACRDRLAEQRKEYDNSNDHAEIERLIQAVRNKINEKFAEEQIDFLFRTQMRSFDVKRIIRKVAVPRRGDAGPEILDMVYKVERIDGKVVFLVIEAKYGSARRGWTRYGEFDVQQFSQEWFTQRIAEIRTQDKGFATSLAKGLKEQRILPFLLTIRSDGSPKNFIDFKVDWNKYRQRN